MCAVRRTIEGELVLAEEAHILGVRHGIDRTFRCPSIDVGAAGWACGPNGRTQRAQQSPLVRFLALLLSLDRLYRGRTPAVGCRSHAGRVQAVSLLHENSDD